MRAGESWICGYERQTAELEVSREGCVCQGMAGMSEIIQEVWWLYKFFGGEHGQGVSQLTQGLEAVQHHCALLWGPGGDSGSSGPGSQHREGAL